MYPHAGVHGGAHGGGHGVANLVVVNAVAFPILGGGGGGGALPGIGAPHVVGHEGRVVVVMEVLLEVVILLIL